jgi:hypothetical protein
MSKAADIVIQNYGETAPTLCVSASSPYGSDRAAWLGVVDATCFGAAVA